MLIYDCEIKKAIQGKEPRIPGIQYCDGWDDFDGMGISVIGVYDYEEDAYRVFCEDNLSAFQELADHHAHNDNCIVGYNSLTFDNRLVGAHGVHIFEDASYDLLVEIWKAVGLGPAFVRETHMGFSLDDMIKANFPDYGKTGDGKMAPVLWQRGQVGTVIDYCLNDVWLTKMLLDRVLNGIPLVNPTTRRLFYIEPPEEA